MTKLPSKKNTHSMILYGKNLFVFMFDLNYFASTSSSGVVRGNLNDGHEDLLECHQNLTGGHENVTGGPQNLIG